MFEIFEKKNYAEKKNGEIILSTGVTVPQRQHGALKKQNVVT